MAATATDEAAKKRRLPAWMVSKGGMAAIAGGTLLLACCGAYAALQGGHEEAPAPAEQVAEIPVPMPVAGVVRRQAKQATDYSIVSVFGGEAYLATADDLVRAKVGFNVPGIGTITAIEAFADGGGSVTGTDAVLRTR